MNPGGIISTVSIIEESLIFDFIISAISNGFFFNSFDNVRAIFVDQLPKTATGKIQKYVLRQGQAAITKQ